MTISIVRAGIVMAPARNGLLSLFRVELSDGTYRQTSLTKSPTNKTVRAASRECGVDEPTIWRALALVPTNPPPMEDDVFMFPIEQLTQPPTPPTPYRLRSIVSSVTVSFATFADALTATVGDGEHVIEWDDIEECCAVDLDYHADESPDPAELESRVWRLQPAPAFWWITRSGGLRLIYLRGPQFTAQEYAATAAMQLIYADQRCTLELVTRTRRPPGTYTEGIQTHTCDYLRTFTGGSTDDDASDWLGDNGYEVGQRYPHSRCPVNPSDAAANNPGGALVVHANYVRCYICERDGIYCGSRDPGYFPLSALAGNRVASKIKRCVEHFTHWGHARYVVEQELPQIPEKMATTIYRALLRLRHGNDPRISVVFIAGEPNGVVRRNGYWANHYGQPLRLDKTSAILAGLPVACDKLMQPIPARVEMIAQPIDLSNNGYPAVTTVWGCRITRNQALPPNRICVVTQPAELRPDDMAWRRARYVEPEDRSMSLDEAWGTIEAVYPRISRDAVTLLIAAKGCTELKSGLPPMVFMSGPTGVGKTSTAMVAAAICGDTVRKIPYTKDTERLFAAVRGAKESGSFASFDEYLKGAKRARLDAESAMELVLDLNEDAVSHLLYVGPVVLGDLPVLVWTDTLIPVEIKRHAQIGRRMHHMFLGQPLQWEESLAAHDIRDPGALRTRGSKQHIAAANVILSNVIDEYFPSGTTTDFARVAESLGFKKLRDSDASKESTDLIRKLFEHVCKMTGGVQTVPADMRTQWVSPTWRYVHIDMGGDAATCLQALCDPKDFASSRIIEEQALKDVLGLKYDTVCDLRKHGFKVAIRFKSVDETRFNEELLS